MSSFVEENDLDALEAAELAQEQREPAPEPDAPSTALVPAEQALVAEHLGGAGLSIIPPETEMRALVQLAVTLSAAQLVPRALQDKPNDTLLVLLTARDLGIKLTTALRLCHPIEGQVSVAPKLKLAIIRERGIARVWPDAGNNGETATWYAVRKDDPETLFRFTFTWEDAQAGGMVEWACEGPRAHSDACKSQQAKKARDRTGPCCKDNYVKWPARMLSWRALGYLMDDACGEVGAGLYSPDELGAITDEDGNMVLDVMEVGPLDGTVEPHSVAQARRKRERAAAGDPKLAPASDADKALLERMLRALPQGGIDVGIELWPSAVGHRIADLPAGKVKTARALVDSLWQRAERGEWGDWQQPFDPDAGSTPPEGSEPPGAPESAPGPEGAPEAPEEQEAAQGPASGDAEAPPPPTQEGVPELADIDAVIDWTAGLPLAEVDERLAALEEAPEGEAENDRRRALAVRTARDLGLL